MSNNPADVVNEALDAAGIEFSVGDLQEGSKPAQVALRHYGQCIRQLLRAVHWDWARKAAPMTLLADATGQTDGVGTSVIAPWVYEYAYPPDCMKARFVPQSAINPNAPPPGNISLPSTPQTTATTQSPTGFGGRLIPSSFLVSLDVNYPVDPSSNWMEAQGASPGGRVVILSNVKQANLVYTAFMPYPSMWDAQFRAALVSYLAAELALPLSRDKSFGQKMKMDLMGVAKDRVMAARVSNGNESGFPQTIDHMPDWMQTRWRGGGSARGDGSFNGGLWGGAGFGWDGSGFMGYGFDQSVF